jgi:hypothetical protein
VIDPIHFDHHPESDKRGDHIQERLVLPDLETRRATFAPTSPMVVDRMFSRHSTVADFDHMQWTERNEGDAFSICESDGPALHVERQIDLGTRNWEYSLSVSVTDPHSETNHWIWEDRAERLVALAHADIVRLADHRHGTNGMQDIYGEIELRDVAEDHPLYKAIAELTIRVFDGRDGRSSISDGHAFGVDLSCDGSGVGLPSLADFEDEDWDNAAAKLPFTREEYQEWALPKPGEADWRRFVPADEFDGEEGEPAETPGSIR